MPNLTRHDITAARVARYRRRMDLRITTQEQAKEFVDDVGFCFLFPIQGIDRPRLGKNTLLWSSSSTKPITRACARLAMQWTSQKNSSNGRLNPANGLSESPNRCHFRNDYSLGIPYQSHKQ